MSIFLHKDNNVIFDVYHFIPIENNNNLFLYHGVHQAGGFRVEDQYNGYVRSLADAYSSVNLVNIDWGE